MFGNFIHTGEKNMATRYLTPPAVADLLGVDHGKILTFIASGELKAHNLAASRAGRPRWRISLEAVEEFLASRTAVPPPAPAKRRKRQPDAAVTEFYK